MANNIDDPIFGKDQEITPIVTPPTSGGILDPGPIAPTPASTTPKLTDGNLDLSGEQPTFTPSTSTSTAEHMTGLLASESPYMTAADTRGRQYAQSRGLLNSSLAAEAVEKARIEAAFPIASQDAGYYQSRGLQEQQGEISGVLQAQQGGINTMLQEQQGRINTNITNIQARSAANVAGIQGSNQLAAIAAQGRLTKELAAINAETQAGLYELQGQINMGLQDSAAADVMDQIVFQAETDATELQYQFEHELEVQRVDNAFETFRLAAQVRVEEMQLSSQDTEIYNATVNTIWSEYQSQSMAIWTNPDMDPASKQAALDALDQRTKDRLIWAADIAEVTLDYPGGEEAGEEEGDEGLPPPDNTGTTPPTSPPYTLPYSYYPYY